MRKHTGTLIKIGITLFALIFVFTQVDVAVIWQKLISAQLSWVLAGFLLFNASLVLRAYRWSVLLVSLDHSVRMGRLIELYIISNFFNSVLPSGITGDVIRAYEAAQDVPGNIAAGTVLIDRATGLMALFMLALLALPFRPVTFPPEFLWQIVAVCLIGLIGGFVVLEGRLVRFFSRFVPRRLRPFWHKLDQVLQAVAACGWPAIWKAMAISILFNLMQIGWWWTSGKALGLNVELGHYFLITPIMALAILLPSIGGLGIRETVAPLLFAGAGLTPGTAVALSLLVFGIERISGLFGAPVYIWSILRRQHLSSNQTT